MAMRKVKVTVTVAGSDGSASGSGESHPVNGRLVGVYLDYVTQPATCDVTITAAAPARTLLTISNANTDAMFYPGHQMHDETGTGVTYDGTNEVYEAPPVDGHLTVTVAQGNAGSVIAYLFVED